MVNKKTF